MTPDQPVGPGPIRPVEQAHAEQAHPEQSLTERVDPRALARLGVPVLAALLMLGAVGGVVWGLVTPGITGVVVRPGTAGALGADTVHRFDAVALFACISFVVGAVSGVVAWWDPRLRGPFAATLAAIGSMAGAGLGIWFGGLVAGTRHGGPAGTAVGDYFASAPSLRLDGARLDMFGGIDLSWAIVVVAPTGALVACLVLLLLGRDPDLGVPVSGRRSQGGELVGDA